METLKWNTHEQSLANKWSKVSFMIKSLKYITSPYMIHSIYFPKFQMIGSLEYYFWGERKITKKKEYLEFKKVIRSMIGVNSRISCK